MRQNSLSPKPHHIDGANGGTRSPVVADIETPPVDVESNEEIVPIKSKPTKMMNVNRLSQESAERVRKQTVSKVSHRQSEQNPISGKNYKKIETPIPGSQEKLSSPHPEIQISGINTPSEDQIIPFKKKNSYKSKLPGQNSMDSLDIGVPTNKVENQSPSTKMI